MEMFIFLKLSASLPTFRAGNYYREEDALIRTCLDVVGFIIVLIESTLEVRLLMEVDQLYKTACATIFRLYNAACTMSSTST